MAKTEKMHRVGAKEATLELEVYREVQSVLNRGQRAGALRMSAEKETIFSDLHLLTAKPVFYVANVDQKQLKGNGSCLKEVTEWAQKEGNKVVVICGDLESELAELKEEEREEFRKELGLEGSSLERLVQAGYEILRLVTFYTTVSSELRAWTVSSGTAAPKAAGKIHTDMERGFIRAEVVSFSDFTACGSEHVAREKGLLRSEGRDYLIRDGDIVHFRFNV
jgi:hypothetical protein